ncbi:hypothetical protein ACQJBY_036220 [Aegilops geniculata]
MHGRRPPFLLLPPWLAAHPQEPPPLSHAPHSRIKLEHRYLGQGVVTLQAARSSAKLSRPCPASRRNTCIYKSRRKTCVPRLLAPARNTTW